MSFMYKVKMENSASIKNLNPCIQQFTRVQGNQSTATESLKEQKSQDQMFLKIIFVSHKNVLASLW